MAGRVRLTPLARRDLREILRYTAHRWSRDQADAYAAQIDRAIRGLASGAIRSRPVSEAMPGFRLSRVGSHFLVHYETGYGTEVVRVLHVGMDIVRHL